MTLRPVGVADADVTLSQFVPTDGKEGWSFDTDYLATITPKGTFDKKYGYLSPYWAERIGEPDAHGWYDYDIISEEDTSGDSRDRQTIPFGTGLAVYTESEGVSIRFAGEVLMDDYGIPLSYAANTFTGVICPSDVILGQLEPTGGKEGWSFDTDYLATISPKGTFDKKYGYLSPYWAERIGETGAEGWYDYDIISEEDTSGESRDNVPLTSGQGLAVYTENTDVELVVPSAIK